MPNYDFLILQPIEFEDLSRDILQAREGVTVETFTDGRDGGIDCRFARMNKTAIIQCKRYKDWKSLKSILTKELKKVKALNPDRYILTTSVGLSPANKNYIKTKFAPYIKNDTDILGRNDLNNEIARYPEIEERHYKLWMSSTHVLEHVLHKEIDAWGGMELSEIREEVSKYVENPSFHKAVKILNEHHFLIISGIPGIGKTTLARMLVLFFMEKLQCDDFVWISQNLDEALIKKSPKRKLIVFYDDFMGKNYFEKNGSGFDKKLSSFIKEIQRAKNIWLIMATREYILQEARMSYDLLYLKPLEEAKYILDLGSYSVLIRGHMLYNHLSAANLPQEYARVLYSHKNYLQLVKHKNFNPRLIETIVNQRDWERIPPSEFMKHLLTFFDKPESVWMQAYEKLNDIAQYALLLLATTPHPIFLEDWYDVVQYFCEQTYDDLHLTLNPIAWPKLIQVLEQSFIRTSKSKEGLRTVDFLNPSVLDFLVAYIKDNDALLKLLLNGIYYIDQIFTTFSEQESKHKNSTLIQIKLIWYNDFVRICKSTLERKETCYLSVVSPYYVSQKKFDILRFGDKFLSNFPMFNRQCDYLVENTIQLDDFAKCNVSSAISILPKLNWDKISFSLAEAQRICLSNVYVLDTLLCFIYECRQAGNVDVIFSQDFDRQLELVVDREVNDCGTEDDCDAKLDYLSQIATEIPETDVSCYKSLLMDRKREIAEENDDDDDTDFIETPWVKEKDEDTRLDEMFRELCQDHCRL